MNSAPQKHFDTPVIVQKIFNKCYADIPVKLESLTDERMVAICHSLSQETSKVLQHVKPPASVTFTWWNIAHKETNPDLTNGHIRVSAETTPTQ